MDWLIAHYGIIFGFLWAACEMLALIPGVEANSVFQLVYNSLKSLKGALSKKSDG